MSRGDVRGTTDYAGETDEEREIGGKEDGLWKWFSVRLEGAFFGLGGKGKRRGRGGAEGRRGDGWLLTWVRGSGVDWVVEEGLAMVDDWRGLLDSALVEEELRDLRSHTRTGWPLGDEAFVSRLERLVGRVLRPRKRGRKPKLPRLPK